MKVTSETPRLPLDALGVQPAGGTPSIQPSAARARVGVACISLNIHDMQFELVGGERQTEVRRQWRQGVLTGYKQNDT